MAIIPGTMCEWRRLEPPGRLRAAARPAPKAPGLPGRLSPAVADDGRPLHQHRPRASPAAPPKPLPPTGRLPPLRLPSLPAAFGEDTWEMCLFNVKDGFLGRFADWRCCRCSARATALLPPCCCRYRRCTTALPRSFLRVAEGVVRGYKQGLLSTADYNNLCQCETLEDIKLYLVGAASFYDCCHWLDCGASSTFLARFLRVGCRCAAASRAPLAACFTHQCQLTLPVCTPIRPADGH